MSLEEIFLSLTTEEQRDAGGGGDPSMRNILAIAHKELRSYFASPIAYIVIGLFALLFGWFFVGDPALLRARRACRWASSDAGPQSMNVNQQMIRPLLQNVTILLLFLLPMVTMRTYSEEKRSGTIELLLTSPLTDLQIILGQVPRRAWRSTR